MSFVVLARHWPCTVTQRSILSDTEVVKITTELSLWFYPHLFLNLPTCSSRLFLCNWQIQSSPSNWFPTGTSAEYNYLHQGWWRGRVDEDRWDKVNWNPLFCSYVMAKPVIECNLMFKVITYGSTHDLNGNEVGLHELVVKSVTYAVTDSHVT